MITADEISTAAKRHPAVVRRTAILPVARTPEEVGRERLLVKMENLQVTGSYKPRAAFHFIDTLTPAQGQDGVVLSSSGNFAQAFGYASAVTGTPAAVVMPDYTAQIKIDATRRYGADVVLCEGFESREPTVRKVARDRGMVALNTFENPEVMVGHGTIGLEIIDQVPKVTTILVPISSGGLAAGIAVAVKSRRPDTRVVGVQPEYANAAYVSWQAGEVTAIDYWDSMADALTARRPGILPFRHLQAYLDDIVLVSEEDIARAFTMLFVRTKTIAEPGGAVAAAAFLSGTVPNEGLTVAVVSGGNTDLATARKMMDLAGD